MSILTLKWMLNFLKSLPLLRVDNRTDLRRLRMSILSPVWIHNPRLDHQHYHTTRTSFQSEPSQESDLPPASRLLEYNTESTYTWDDTVYNVTRAECQLECMSLVDRGANGGICDDDMRPISFDKTSKWRTKPQGWNMNHCFSSFVMPILTLPV